MSTFIKDLIQAATVTPLEKTEEEKELEDQTPDAQIQIHKGEQIKVLNAQYLNNIFPEKLNKLTVSTGVSFRFNFLSKSLHYWVEIIESQQSNPEKLGKNNFNQIQNILKAQDNLLFERWQQYLQNKQQFQKNIQIEGKFVAPGDSRKIFNKGQKKFEITYANGGDKQLLEYRQRFELLLIMFIDGASYISQDDPTWGYYIVYQLDKDNQRHFVGLLSKYTFKITSKRQRQRISQVFILPCYQKLGLGKQLLDQFYQDSINKEECFQITVEGPSFQFQCLRNYKQVQMILKGNLFKDDKIQLSKLKTSDDINQLRALYLSNENIRSIKNQFKLPGQQIDTIVNILIYSRVLASNQQFLRATFEDLLRQKIMSELAAFKDRDIIPSLFIENKPLDTKNYLLVKAKQQFLLRNSGQVQQILNDSLNSFRNVVQKLKKQALI